MTDILGADGLDNQIRSGYPYPLAATYYRAYFGSSDRDEIHEHLLDLFEVTLKFLASLGMSQYLAQDVNDPQINKDLLALERPSLGHWQGWLRDILALYRRQRRPLLLPELGEFYLKKHSGDISSACGSLRQIMAERMGYEGAARTPATVTTQQFFELLGEYRNRLAHGARANRYDRERVAGILMPAMRQLFAELAFLAEYPLVYVNLVNVEFVPSGRGQSRFVHHLTYLTGDRPRVSHRPEILERDPAHARELYLLDKGGGFRPLLSLHPFLIFRHCESCNVEQAFVLNTSREKTLDYLSYQCTHHFNPTEYVEYMSGLLHEIRRASAGAATLGAIPAVPPAPVSAETTAASATSLDAPEGGQESLRQQVPPPATAGAHQQAPASAPDPPATSPPASAAAERVPDLRVAALQPAAADQAGPASGQTAARAAEIDFVAPATLPPEVSWQPLEGTAVPAREAAATRPAAPAAAAQPQPEDAAGGVATIRLSGAAESAAPGTPMPAATAPALPRPARRPNLLIIALAGLLVLALGAAFLLLQAPPAPRTISPENAAQLQLLRSWQGDPNNVYWLAFTPDGARLVSAGNASAIRLWSVPDGAAVLTMTGHAEGVFSVAVSPDGRTIASTSQDRTVRLWDARSGAPLKTLGDTAEHAFTRVAFAPGEPLLAAISDEQSPRLWRLPGGEPLAAPDVGGAYSLGFSRDGALAIAQYGGIQLWPLPDGEPRRFEAAADTLWGMAFDSQGQFLAGGSGDGTIRVWRLETGELLSTVAAHTGEVYSIAFSPDGRVLASTSDDGTVRLWRVSDGAPLATLLENEHRMTALAFAPTGNLLAAGGDGGKIYLWQPRP